MDEGHGARQWPKLRDAGVPALLRKAAEQWNQYEFSQHISYYRNTPGVRNAVDVWGALRLAAGGKFARALDPLPPNTEGLFDAAIAFVESAIDQDLHAWNDTPGRTKGDAVRLLNRLADELETTI